jgi:hypothetical protein
MVETTSTLGYRSRRREAGLGAHDLNRPVLAVLDAEVVQIGVVGQPRVEWLDVVELKVELEEDLPVDRVIFDQHPVEHVAGEVEIRGNRERGELETRVARAGEQQPLPVREWGRGESEAGSFAEVRRTEQLAAQVIGPAVQRANDVFAVPRAFEHDRLAVAADVGQQFDAGFVVHQHLGVIQLRQRAVVARVGHHELVPHVVRPCLEHQLLLKGEDFRVEVPRQGQLGVCRPEVANCGDVGHRAPQIGRGILAQTGFDRPAPGRLRFRSL